MLGDLLSKLLADDVHQSTMPIDAVRVPPLRRNTGLRPSGTSKYPKSCRSTLPKVIVGDLESNVPARRLLVNIVVAVKEAGTIGVVVGSVPQVAPLGEFGRSKVRAFRIPTVIVVSAGLTTGLRVSKCS